MGLFKNQKGFSDVVTMTILSGIIGAIFIGGVFVWKEHQNSYAINNKCNDSQYKQVKLDICPDGEFHEDLACDCKNGYVKRTYTFEVGNVTMSCKKESKAITENHFLTENPPKIYDWVTFESDRGYKFDYPVIKDKTTNPLWGLRDATGYTDDFDKFPEISQIAFKIPSIELEGVDFVIHAGNPYLINRPENSDINKPDNIEPPDTESDNYIELLAKYFWGINKEEEGHPIYNIHTNNKSPKEVGDLKEIVLDRERAYKFTVTGTFSTGKGSGWALDKADIAYNFIFTAFNGIDYMIYYPSDDVLAERILETFKFIRN